MHWLRVAHASVIFLESGVEKPRGLLVRAVKLAVEIVEAF